MRINKGAHRAQIATAQGIALGKVRKGKNTA